MQYVTYTAAPVQTHDLYKLDCGRITLPYITYLLTTSDLYNLACGQITLLTLHYNQSSNRNGQNLTLADAVATRRSQSVSQRHPLRLRVAGPTMAAMAYVRCWSRFRRSTGDMDESLIRVAVDDAG